MPQRHRYLAPEGGISDLTVAGRSLEDGWGAETRLCFRLAPLSLGERLSLGIGAALVSDAYAADWS